MHCSDVTAMHKEYMCLVASRDVKLSMLKRIGLREKGESSMNFLLYVVHTAVTERSPLYILYVTMPTGKAQAVNHDDGTRLQALALAEAGIATKIVTAITEISRFTVSRLKKQARDRGYDPSKSKKLLLSYVSDAPRPGRPPIITPELESAILAAVRKDRYGREKTSFMLGAEQGISSTTVLRVLRRNNFRSCKTTKKPSLTEAMMEARYQFALRYKDWTVEQWKDVIWSDETSVILNSRRGRVRVWRQPHEVFVKFNVRRRFVGAMEFMFWGCFSYDKKGPYHIWRTETAKEKKACAEDLAAINKALEPECKLAWEMETGIRRLGLRNLPGKKPEWHFTAKTGKVTIEGKKGGITWYRYQKKVCVFTFLNFLTLISHRFSFRSF